MKRKQILILVVLLIALAVGIVIKQTQKVPELSTEEYAPLDLSFDTSKAIKLEILKGKDEKLVDLAKTDGNWQVVNFHNARADRNKIENLFKAITGAKGEVRGKDKNLFSDFGIADEAAYQIVISSETPSPTPLPRVGEDKGEGVLIHFYLGTKKPAYGSVFLRQGDSESVYFVATDLFGQIGLYEDPAKVAPKSDYWASSNLVDFPVDDVNQVQVTKFEKGAGIELAHVSRQTDPNDLSKKKWQFARNNSPFSIDSEKIKQFLNSLKTLSALKVLDPKAQNYGFDQPRSSLKLGLEGGKEILIKVGSVNPGTNARYISVSNEPVVFELSDYNAKSLEIDDSRFFVDNPLGVDPEKITKFVIKLGQKEHVINHKEKPSEIAKNYLSNLKTFTVSRLLFKSDEVKKADASPSQILTLYPEAGEPIVLKVGVALSDQPKEYAARTSGDSIPLAITEAQYKAIFENQAVLNSN